MRPRTKWTMVVDLVPLADRVMRTTGVHAVASMKVKTAMRICVNNE